MTAHLSARLIWHDRGWDGHICNDPGKNSFCEAHETVREHKDVKLENKNAGKSLAELDPRSQPACESCLQNYSSNKNKIIHYPPSFMTKATPKILELSPFSSLNWPFEAMWTEEGGHKEQPERLKIVNAFYDEIRESLGKSLIFFYVDERNPVAKETANRIGQRVLLLCHQLPTKRL